MHLIKISNIISGHENVDAPTREADYTLEPVDDYCEILFYMKEQILVYNSGRHRDKEEAYSFKIDMLKPETSSSVSPYRPSKHIKELEAFINNYYIEEAIFDD